MNNPENDTAKQCKCCGWSHGWDACPHCGYDDEVIEVEDYAFFKLQTYCTDHEHVIFKQHLTDKELKELEL